MTKEIVFGKNSVESLLKNLDRSVNKIYLLSTINKDNKIRYIEKLAKKRKIPISTLSKDKFKALLKDNVNHQGIIASVPPIEYVDLNTVLLNIKDSKTLPTLVLLDNIEDPQNFGAIIRSSEVLGANAIIIPTRRSVSVTSIVSKISSGAVEFIPIVQVTNLVKTIEFLKKEGFWVVGAEYETESKFLYETDYNFPCVLVMGSEGKGISRLVKASCDLLIKIPQQGKTSSLNVASALSIVLYEINRQRVIANLKDKLN